MCDALPRLARVAVGVGFAWIAAFAAIGSCDAQDVNALRQRLAELESLWQQAVVEIEQAQQLALPDVGLDTARVGALSVAYERGMTNVVEPAVTSAAQVMAQMLGRSSSLLRDAVVQVTITIDPSSGLERNVHVRIAGIDRSYMAHGDEVHDMSAVISRQILIAVDDYLNVVLPSALREWTRLTFVTRSSAQRRDDAELYMKVVTIPFAVTRDCLSGDTGRCRLALGIDETPDPLTDLLSEADRRQWAARYSRPDHRVSPDLATAYAWCVDEHDMDACTEFLRRNHVNARAPLGDEHRRHVTEVALRLGGEGAITRLFNSGGTVTTVLESAAGVEMDSVLRAWHWELRASGGRPIRITTRNAAGAIVWTLVCLAAALRSTRWR